MRIIRLALLLILALILVDFLITNDSAVYIGIWPFTGQIQLSVGLLGLFGIVIGMLIMFFRSIIKSAIGFIKPSK